MVNELSAILVILAVVAGVSLLSRKLPIPYPVLLVGAGLILAFIPGMPRPLLNPDMVFYILLPLLIYPAALLTPWRDFQENLRPISLLAVGLVLFTTVTIGYITHYFIPALPLAAGFVLGAIISPTDAIAAVAIAHRMRMPHRIVVILEGESLVNDATALVALRFAVAALATGSFELGPAIGRFLLVALGGLVAGLLIGFVVTEIHKRLDDPAIEITISLLTPFVAYLTAERFHLSGVLAVVATGLYQGWRIPEFTTTKMRLQAGSVWEMIDFVLNGFIFLMLGLQLPAILNNLTEYSRRDLIFSAVVISIAVILLRILWVFPATYLPRLLSARLRQRDPYPSWRSVLIVGWTGMRGVISLAAALALPLALNNGQAFPARNLILFLTYVVIMVTLVAQGLTLPWLLKKLNVIDDGKVQREEHNARIKANQAAVQLLDEYEKANRFPLALIQRLRVEYADRLEQLAGEDSQTGVSSRLFSAEFNQLTLEALEVERRTLIQLRDNRDINDEVLRHIQRDVDLAETRLKSG